MPESWVVNASPLIVLSQIGQDRLLSSLADELIVPQAVADELRRGILISSKHQNLGESC
jgi:predicted nucleic acid-binding protein